MSDPFKNLVLQCLAVNPHDRPPAMQLVMHRSLCKARKGSGNFAGVHVNGQQGSSQNSPRLHPQDVAKDFLWLPVCGLIAICNLDSDASVQAAQHASPRDVGSGWKERRDGSIQLNRLASNSFERALEADDDSL